MTFEKEFNKFIKNWCGNHYAHLVDSDENEGQYVRNYVEENYIPKQKVKDAIEKYHDAMLEANDDYSVHCCIDTQKKSAILEEIKKELDLE